jgi:hypothetical protein
MRVVWRDTAASHFKPLKYKGYAITGSPQGWCTEYPGDDNLYKSLEDAKLSINEHLGITTRPKSCRIDTARIVGKKSETA